MRCIAKMKKNHLMIYCFNEGSANVYNVADYYAKMEEFTNEYGYEISEDGIIKISNDIVCNLNSEDAFEDTRINVYPLITGKTSIITASYTNEARTREDVKGLIRFIERLSEFAERYEE